MKCTQFMSNHTTPHPQDHRISLALLGDHILSVQQLHIGNCMDNANGSTYGKK